MPVPPSQPSPDEFVAEAPAICDDHASHDSAAAIHVPEPNCHRLSESPLSDELLCSGPESLMKIRAVHPLQTYPLGLPIVHDPDGIAVRLGARFSAKADGVEGVFEKSVQQVVVTILGSAPRPCGPFRNLERGKAGSRVPEFWTSRRHPWYPCRMRASLRTALYGLSVVLLCIGLIGLPDQLRCWLSLLVPIDWAGNAGRWVAVISGLIFVALLNRVPQRLMSFIESHFKWAGTTRKPHLAHSPARKFYAPECAAGSFEPGNHMDLGAWQLRITLRADNCSCRCSCGITLNLGSSIGFSMRW